MNYLESLSDNERFIINEIVIGCKEKSISLFDKDMPVSDKLGIHLYELLGRLMQNNNIHTENIAYRIDVEDGGIHLYHFFEINYITKTFGEEYNKKLEEMITHQIHSLIIGTSFISKLYEDGLIYFPDESFEESKFEEWYIPLEDYPKPNYIWKFSNIRSKRIAKFLDSFLQSSILPSFQLIELYENKYKTVEALRYDEQQATNEIALKRAKRANIIAIVIAIVSMVVSIICAVSIPVTISDRQHKEVIEVLKTNHNG